ncbi:MAG: class I SAM-dependent methyltransferase [Halarsenatibacteraceae bacterium]
MMEWTDQEIKWYQRALKANYYPDNLMDYIKPLLTAKSNILDIGTGIGALSLKLMEAGFKVTAIDQSGQALSYLKNIIEKNDFLGEIKLEKAEWPEFAKNYEDNSWAAVFTSYTGPEVIGDKKSLAEMDRLASNYVLLWVPGEKIKHSFNSDQLFKSLGRKLREYNCPDSRVVELLKELEKNYQKKDFNYQFGQPFEDFNDAVKFFANHYNIESKEEKVILERFLKEELREKSGQLWAENIKKSSLIYWKPAESRVVNNASGK